MNSNKNKKISSFFSWLQKLFWGFAFAVSLFFVIIYFQRYLAVRQWHKAHNFFMRGKYQEAENIYSNIHPKLNWNGKFLAQYGDVVMRTKNYKSAIDLYEKAILTYPSPYLFENLGGAYINYSAAADFQQSIMNEEHPPNSSTSSLTRGSSLSRGECINKAINYWMLSSNILPWRLTPKFYLADLFYQIGDTNNAIKYAWLVVNTPMKKWTERGVEFKLKSQKMLNELGKPGNPFANLYCDDPGLIVFDINDKKTWNVGKW